MRSNGTIELYYDPDNKQINHLFIAEVEGCSDAPKKEVVGYLVVEEPWYASENQYIYWLYYTRYYGEHHKLERELIKPETLRPYTQTEEIKKYLKYLNVSLKKDMYVFENEEPEDNLVAFIECGEDLPKGLWKDETI